MCGAGVLDKEMINLDFWTGWPRRFYNIRSYDDDDEVDGDHYDVGELFQEMEEAASPSANDTPPASSSVAAPPAIAASSGRSPPPSGAKNNTCQREPHPSTTNSPRAFLQSDDDDISVIEGSDEDVHLTPIQKTSPKNKGTKVNHIHTDDVLFYI